MHNPSTIFLIAFFLCFQLCFSLSDLQLIPLDSTQVHTLSTDSPLKFKILNSLSPSVGSFNITVAPASDQRSAFVVVTREKCANEPGTSELSFEQLSYRQELSVISFVANTSNDHCFHLEFVRNTQYNAINYSIKVTFTPIQPVLMAGIPHSTYLQENASQEFAYNYQDHPVEIVRITLKNSAGSAEKTNALFPRLSQIRGNCLESSSEISWLCYLYNQQGFLKFSLYNPNKSEFYEILISDVTPENIASDAETTIKYSISGFGSIFKTCLSLIGILKVNAKTVNDKVLAMTGASSLYNLFGALTSGTDGFGQPEAASNNAQGLILQNKQVNTAWFYFVEEEQGEDSFLLSSYFIRQVPLDVGIKATYMIDPELYEYQHIDLKLGNRDFPEKYEVSVWSEGNQGLMNLYFDTNSYDIGYALFPDEQLYRKRASPAATNGELFLSFIVGAHDTSAYLSIHALKKGMYSIQATRVETRSVWEGIFIVALISCMVAYLFSCLAKIFTMSKSNEFDDFSEWPEIPRDNVPANHAPETPNEQDIEADLAEIHSSVAVINENEIYSTRQLLPGLKTMVKKLKRQERLERKIKKNKRQAEKEEEKENNNDHVVLEISEADTCDICYEAKKTVTFGPCGHQCTCAFCALIIVKTSAKCPLCRSNINKVQVNQDIQNELKKTESKEKEEKNEKDNKEEKEGENDRQD